MPVDRPTQMNPPSWPVPHLREDDADNTGQAAPPPLSGEPTPWPDAPHLREDDAAESGAAESVAALPPYPPEPTWPESPHLRAAESGGEPPPRKRPRSADRPQLLPADPSQLRPGEVARWAAIASLRPAVTTLRPVARPAHEADPKPPPAEVAPASAKPPTARPASSESPASPPPAGTPPRSAAATAWPDVTTLRPPEPPQVRPPASIAPPAPSAPPALSAPPERPAEPGPTPRDVASVVPTARLDRGRVQPHVQEPKPSSPPWFDRLPAPMRRFRFWRATALGVFATALVVVVGSTFLPGPAGGVLGETSDRSGTPEPPTPAPTPQATATDDVVLPAASPSPSPSPLETPSATPTPLPTAEPTPKVTPRPTARPTPRPTPRPTVKPTATPSPAPTPTPISTPIPTPIPTPTLPPTPEPSTPEPSTPSPPPT
jgi:hypothetical protein